MAMRQDSGHPTGVATDDGKDNQPEVVRARDRKANSAITLRIAGASWDEIAEVIGYPTARAALVATEKALEKELATEGSQLAMRQMASRRLDKLLTGVWTKATDPENPEHLAAVGKARELIADFRRLHGTDAPAELIVHNPTEREIEEWIAERIKTTVPDLEEDDIFEGDWYEDEPKALEG